jgi:nucleoid DNA-binding protein
MNKEELIEMISKIVSKISKIEAIEESIDKIYFKLPDDLTRKEVEAIVTQINNSLATKMISVTVSPFGTPFKRGFHIKKKYLY